MISFLKGELIESDEYAAILEVGGIGYRVGMASRALARLPEKGKTVKIFTYLQVREDALSLYGFLSEDERHLFTRLIEVSGVGPKVALAALSTFDASDLVSAILSEDVAAVSTVPGIGKKTASRIVLELRGSLERTLGAPSAHPSTPAFSEVSEALRSLGFDDHEITKALEGAPEDADEGRLLQYALRSMGA